LFMVLEEDKEFFDYTTTKECDKMVKIRKNKPKEKIIIVPMYGIGNKIYGYEYYRIIPKNKIPKDLSYQGVSGNDYFGSMTILYSPSKKKHYYQTYFGKFVELIKETKLKKPK